MALSSTGTIIYGADYNAVQTKVQGILGTGSPYGSGNYGYGHDLQSSQVVAGSVITADQWNKLIADVDTTYYHITGVDYTGYASSVNGNIQVNYLNNADAAMNYAITGTNRLTVAASQQTQTTPYTRSHAGTWGGGPTGITTNFSITFASADAARYFFNAGGKLTIQGTYAYGSSTPQNNAWNSLMGSFSYTINVTEWAYIQAHSAPSFATLYGTTPYYLNYVSITAASVSSTVVELSIKYEDDHTNVWADSVDGTIGFNVVQNKANFTTYQPTLAYTTGY